MLPVLAKIKDRLFALVRQVNAPGQDIAPVLEQSINVRLRDKSSPIIIQAGVVNQTITISILNIIQEIEEMEDEAKRLIMEDPLPVICQWFFEHGRSYAEMKKTMKYAYIHYVLSQFRTTDEAAKALDMQRSYVSRLKNEEVWYEA